MNANESPALAMLIALDKLRKDGHENYAAKDAILAALSSAQSAANVDEQLFHPEILSPHITPAKNVFGRAPSSAPPEEIAADRDVFYTRLDKWVRKASDKVDKEERVAMESFLVAFYARCNSRTRAAIDAARALETAQLNSPERIAYRASEKYAQYMAECADAQSKYTTTLVKSKQPLNYSDVISWMFSLIPTK